MNAAQCMHAKTQRQSETPYTITLLSSFHLDLVHNWTLVAHDHLISVLGARFLRFEFSWGAVPFPVTAGEAVAEEAADDLVFSRSLTPASLLEGAGCGTSSLKVGVAMEDLEVLSIEVPQPAPSDWC